MLDLGEMSYFLGMEIHQATIGIFNSQRKYAWDIFLKGSRWRGASLYQLHWFTMKRFQSLKEMKGLIQQFI